MILPAQDEKIDALISEQLLATQREMNRILSEALFSPTRHSFPYLESLGYRRSLWEKTKDVVWRLRERVAGWIYPCESNGEW